jgi:isocitrate/isopropylmalate dehydrogenase
MPARMRLSAYRFSITCPHCLCQIPSLLHCVTDSLFDRAAKTIEAAIDSARQQPATRTSDLNGSLGIRAFAEEIVKRVARAS